jgi:hypothetical protein
VVRKVQEKVECLPPVITGTDRHGRVGDDIARASFFAPAFLLTLLYRALNLIAIFYFR